MSPAGSQARSRAGRAGHGVEWETFQLPVSRWSCAGHSGGDSPLSSPASPPTVRGLLYLERRGKANKGGR